MAKEKGKKRNKSLDHMIDLRNRKWDQQLSAPSPNMTNTLKLKQYIAKQHDWNCLCESKMSGCWIKIGKRIGSESNAGMVFEVKFPGFLPPSTAVAKIMPQDIKGNWRREVEIATFLSSQVEQKKTVFFPVVYAVLTDRKVLLPVHTNPISKYRGVEEDENTPPAARKRATKPLDVCAHKVVMLSERSWGDVKQFASYLKQTNLFTTEEQVRIWLDVLRQIAEAVCELGKLGILHNDLHTGNVLVDPILDKTTNTVQFRIKIHDFGNSRAIDSDDTLDLTWDMQQILGEMAELPTPLSSWFAWLQSQVAIWKPSEEEPCFQPRFTVEDIEQFKREQEKKRKTIRKGRK